jgi:hypothetical protein
MKQQKEEREERIRRNIHTKVLANMSSGHFSGASKFSSRI